MTQTVRITHGERGCSDNLKVTNNLDEHECIIGPASCLDFTVTDTNSLTVEKELDNDTQSIPYVVELISTYPDIGLKLLHADTSEVVMELEGEIASGVLAFGDELTILEISVKHNDVETENGISTGGDENVGGDDTNNDESTNGESNDG